MTVLRLGVSLSGSFLKDVSAYDLDVEREVFRNPTEPEDWEKLQDALYEYLAEEVETEEIIEGIRDNDPELLSVDRYDQSEVILE